MRSPSRLALGLVLLAAFCLLAPAGHAQTFGGCTFTAHVHLSPGASFADVTGTFTTRASGVYGDAASPLETGMISCAGGSRGSGTAGFEGHNGTTPPGEDCAHGTGDGVLSYTIDGRNERVPYTAARGLLIGAFAGSASDSSTPIVGAYTFTPDANEDCVTAPVTGASVTGVLFPSH